MLAFISCLSRTLQILRQCCLEMRGHDQKHGVYLCSRNNLKEANSERQRETEIYVLGTALRQHMQELSWSCLTGFLPVFCRQNLVLTVEAFALVHFWKRLEQLCSVLWVFAWCQTGYCKQIQVFTWKKSCLVHLLTFPLSVSCLPLHVSITLSTLGLCLCTCIWSHSGKDEVLSECCPLPCGGILEGSNLSVLGQCGELWSLLFWGVQLS